jgi:sulfoxide reductase catalytic subunit YedY
MHECRGRAGRPAEHLGRDHRYNNFYEFGTGKTDPAEEAPRTLKTRPWTVRIDGPCARPGAYVPLRDVIARAQSRPSAKYVELTTLFDPVRMPGRRPCWAWSTSSGR